MMSSNQVVSRETYLKFRQEWKNVYKSLSSEIRETRKIARTPGDSDAQAHAQSRLVYLRQKARNMMEELDVVKAKRPVRVPEQVAA
jgi:hypothetical protein